MGNLAASSESVHPADLLRKIGADGFVSSLHALTTRPSSVVPRGIRGTAEAVPLGEPVEDNCFQAVVTLRSCAVRVHEKCSLIAVGVLLHNWRRWSSVFP
jgi:hypothetical protein